MKFFTIYATERKIIIVSKIIQAVSSSPSNGPNGCYYKILRIDRNPPDVLSLSEDKKIYTQIQMNKMLVMLSNTYKSSGGVKQLGKGCAILGLII